MTSSKNGAHLGRHLGLNLKFDLTNFSVKVKITMHDKCRIGIKFAISFLPFFFHFIFLLFFFLFLIFPKKRKKNK